MRKGQLSLPKLKRAKDNWWHYSLTRRPTAILVHILIRLVHIVALILLNSNDFPNVMQQVWKYLENRPRVYTTSKRIAQLYVLILRPTSPLLFYSYSLVSRGTSNLSWLPTLRVSPKVTKVNFRELPILTVPIIHKGPQVHSKFKSMLGNGVFNADGTLLYFQKRN